MSSVSLNYLAVRLSVILVLVAVVTRVSAQKPKPSPSPTPGDDQVITTQIRRVRLPITITDKKGAFVPGLTKADFIILEDKIPQQIETFSDDTSQTTRFTSVY